MVSLLSQFRAAAAIEHRLIELERWLLSDRPEPGTDAHRRKWTVCLLRLCALRLRNPRFDFDSAFAYLRNVHEVAA
jgi:hypothetical protein